MTVEKLEEVKIDLNRIYTAEEFARLEDDGKRYELIDGRLVLRLG
jgi:hypothetical protein